MKLPRNITIGDKYRPAMEITNKREAARYFNACVEHTMRVAKVSIARAREIERRNIGYFAGYYGTDTRLRVEELYGVEHPVFGKAKDGVPTPGQAFHKGLELASDWKDRVCERRNA